MLSISKKAVAARAWISLLLTAAFPRVKLYVVDELNRYMLSVRAKIIGSLLLMKARVSFSQLEDFLVL